ncbi:MAG: hypothetical protein JWN84_1540 [Nocardioides sp.]|nr:hypothetical protein [Nocardioides sp.]
MTEQPPAEGEPTRIRPPAGPPPPPPPPGWSPPAYPSYPPPSYPPSGWQQPAPRKRRTGLVLAVVAAVLVLAVAVVVPVVLLADDDEGERARDAATSQAPPDLSEVVTYDDLPTTHVTEPVDYEQVPPVGGPHYGAWLDCGAYDEPVPSENAVHDLEHGAVWITYAPDLSDDDVAALEAALPQNGIMSPYDGLPSPVVVTVWGAQLALTGADDPRLPLFVEEYDDGVTAPEPTASCAGGLTPGPEGQPA